jgi:hypothetical protein
MVSSEIISFMSVTREYTAYLQWTPEILHKPALLFQVPKIVFISEQGLNERLRGRQGVGIKLLRCHQYRVTRVNYMVCLLMSFLSLFVCGSQQISTRP